MKKLTMILFAITLFAGSALLAQNTAKKAVKADARHAEPKTTKATTDIPIRTLPIGIRSPLQRSARESD